MKIKYVERPLRIYFKAEVGDQIRIKRRKATIVRIIPYKEVINEMISQGASEREIEGFNRKVRLYLGNRRRYFECEVKYEDGTVEHLDWWQYTDLRFREEERKWFEEQKKK